MTVTFAGKPYDCSKAIREKDHAALHLTGGGTVEFGGVSDWNVFKLENGEWSAPEVSVQEQLRADVDFLSIMTGVEL